MRRIVVMLALVIACGGDKSKAIDAAPGGDAGVDAPSNPPPIDGNMPDASQGVACGAMTCVNGQEECCFTMPGAGTCDPAGSCAGVAFTCDGPEDCPGAVCCVRGNNPGTPGGSECRNPCQTQDLCHTNGDCGGGSPKCCQLGTSDYKVCLAQCPP
jgi:hypothetical protein